MLKGIFSLKSFGPIACILIALVILPSIIPRFYIYILAVIFVKIGI